MSISVGVLGATGLVGQRLLVRLENHPQFDVVAIAASEDRIGEPFEGSVPWRIDEPRPTSFDHLTFDKAAPGELTGDPPLVLSALPGSVATETEPAFAEAGVIVCSNASPLRMAEDVPLVIPEVNADHLSLIDEQRRSRGWDGAIIKNPNCMTTTIALPFAGLSDLGLDRATIVTMQAISGAGTGGVFGIDIVDNVLPDIPGEAPKLATEPRKLLGTVTAGQLTQHPISIDAACHRVPVLDGHFATCFVELDEAYPPSQVRAAIEGLEGVNLPSAPAQPITVIDEPRRPQPRIDRDLGAGMGVAVGPISVEQHRVSFSCLAHNTIRGAAGACLIAAEAAVDDGYLD